MANKKQEAAKKTVVKKKKKKLSIPKVIIKVTATYNNTIAVATDYSGNVVAASSCGLLGFTGSKKSTVYAATRVGEDLAQKSILNGAREAEVVVTGIGVGRQATIKGIRSGGLRITSLSDRTAIPHGGCKPRRKPKK